MSLIISDVRNPCSACVFLLSKDYMYGPLNELFGKIRGGLLTCIVTLLRDDFGFTDSQLSSVIHLLDDCKRSNDIRVTHAMAQIANTLGLGKTTTNVFSVPALPLPNFTMSADCSYVYQLARYQNKFKKEGVVDLGLKSADSVVQALKSGFPNRIIAPYQRNSPVCRTRGGRSAFSA